MPGSDPARPLKIASVAVDVIIPAGVMLKVTVPTDRETSALMEPPLRLRELVSLRRRVSGQGLGGADGSVGPGVQAIVQDVPARIKPAGQLDEPARV